MSKKAGCIGFLLNKKTTKTDETLPYQVRDDFLSDAELSFYKVLAQLFKKRYVICPKVSLKDIFYVTKANDYITYFNRINRKHIDFLICEKSMMKPLIGIELDDSSHSKQKRQERDQYVDEVFQVAGLPLARVKASSSYNIDELKNYLSMVYKAKNPSHHHASVKNVGNTTNSKINEKLSVDEVANSSTGSSVTPICPKCDIPLVKRKSRKGELFYGCSNYPKCKVTIGISEQYKLK